MALLGSRQRPRRALNWTCQEPGSTAWQWCEADCLPGPRNSSRAPEPPNEAQGGDATSAGLHSRGESPTTASWVAPPLGPPPEACPDPQPWGPSTAEPALNSVCSGGHRLGLPTVSTAVGGAVEAHPDPWRTVPGGPYHLELAGMGTEHGPASSCDSLCCPFCPEFLELRLG